MKKSYVYLPAVASAKAGTPNSQILYQRDHTKASGSDEFFYVHDRLGSVRLVVDESETTKNSYTYDPTGVDFATEVTESAENPFKYTGQWFDDEISQYYLRARMYDPELMRFTGYDPVRGEYNQPLTTHRYLYCKNDSINRIDPSGALSSVERYFKPMAEAAYIASSTVLSMWDKTSKAVGPLSLAVSTAEASLYSLNIIYIKSMQHIVMNEILHEDLGVSEENLLPVGWDLVLWGARMNAGPIFTWENYRWMPDWDGAVIN